MRLTSSGSAATLGLLLLTACGLEGPREPADRVFLGGPIVTLNDEAPVVEAVAVRNGRIFALGSREEIRAVSDDDTEVTDLGGRTLAPGLVDGHVMSLKGSIEEGKLADLVILSANPLDVDSARIAEIDVHEAIREGKTVWQRE